MKEVTDPSLLDTLNRNEVTDPAILAQLNGTPPPAPDKPVKGDKTVGGFIKNAAGDVVDIGKGLYQIVRHPLDTASAIGDLAVGGSAALQKEMGLLDEMQSFTGESAARKLAEPFVTAARNPVGIPQQMVDYVYEKPVSAAMNLSTGLGLAGKAAEVGGAARLAGVLAKGSEIVNPITQGSKLVTGPLNAIANSTIPESIYASALKMPPGSLRDEVGAGVLKTMVRDEKLPLGKKTLSTINETVKTLETDINAAVSRATVSGAEADVTKIVSTLENLKKQYANRPDPEKYYRAIDRVKKDIADHDFVRRVGASKIEGFEIDPSMPTGIRDVIKDASFSAEKFPLNKALDLKKGIYQEIQDYYMKRNKPETGRVGIRNDIDSVAKAETAKVLRQEILDSPDISPAIKAEMKREAGLMNARKWVERATNRGGNTEPLSLAGMLFGAMVEKGLPAAATYQILMSQPIKSRIAIMLTKARQPISSTATNAAFQAQQIGNQ